MYEYKNPYILDFTNVKNYIEVHQIIKKAFDFPDYYGENWDAFWDCMRDMVDEDAFNIHIYGYENFKKRFPSSAKIFSELLEDMRHFNNDRYVNNVTIMYMK